jgi:hypothetical protein
MVRNQELRGSESVRSATLIDVLSEAVTIHDCRNHRPCLPPLDPPLREVDFMVLVVPTS